MENERIVRAKNSHRFVQTKRLFLAPMETADAPQVFKWAGDQRVTKFLRYTPYSRMEDLYTWIGSLADVTNGYGWGIDATLVNIKTDTQNATGSDKILTFNVEGDVTAGQSLSFSISCSSANYDCVVPTSAVMEDKDGKFVMVVTAKSTPLGNRYYANRVSVDVLASDEISSAVSGDIMSSDFVITTSEKPLENGMQIRMED